MSRGFSQHIEQNLIRCERRGLLFAPSHRCDTAACRRRAERGIIIEPFRGIFARAAYWKTVKETVKPYQIIRTLSAAHPDWVFCSFSAACIYGLWVSTRLLERVHIAVGPMTHSGGAESLVRHKLENVDARHVVSVPVTSLERTVVDCLRVASFPEGLAIADSAARMPHWNSARFARLLNEASGKRGVCRARTVASHIDARSESGGESIARARMIELGFAVPELQIAFPNVLARGDVFYVDYLWSLPDGKRIAGEMDGLEKYTLFTGGGQPPTTEAARQRAIRSLVKERQRESRLTAVCDGVARFTYADVMDDDRFTAILSAYGIPRGRLIACRVSAAVRPTKGDE